MNIHIANFEQADLIPMTMDEGHEMRITAFEANESPLGEDILSRRDAMHDKSLGRTIGAEASQLPGKNTSEFVSPASAAHYRMEASANKIQMLVHPHRTRLRPPTSRSRIYSDAELALATEMFHKLKQGGDRRPHPKQRSYVPTPGPIDPLDRVADVLLDLFDL